MIEAALSLIADELDQALSLGAAGGGGLVSLSNLVDSGGAAVPEAANKVAVFLVNIEREVIPTRGPRRVDANQDRVAMTPPPIHLNLLVMFAANFSGPTYDEALKLISATIGFFQSRPKFDPVNTPALDPGIDQLTFEIENLSATDLSNLWGIFGGRYLPSVLYRVRMVTIDARRPFTQPRRVERVLVDAEPVGSV